MNQQAKKIREEGKKRAKEIKREIKKQIKEMKNAAKINKPGKGPKVGKKAK